MSTTSPLALTLQQRKVYTGSAPRTARFAVQSLVTPSTEGGAAAAAAFILGPASGVDMERLVRMLDLTVPADVALPVNPLSYFKDTLVDISSVAVPSVLRIGKITPSDPVAPGEWDSLGTLPDTYDFTLAAVDVPNQRVEIDGVFWWGAQDLVWEVRTLDLSTVLLSGSNGFTQRENPVLLEWRADRFTAAYDESPAALSHITATQAYVRSLAKQANVDPSSYLQAPPGNPISNTY